MRSLTLVLMLAPLVAAAEPVTIHVPLDAMGEAVITYDPTRVKEDDLRRAAALAPLANPERLVTDGIDTCYDAAGASTAPCGGDPYTPESPSFFRNAEIAMKRNQVTVAAAAARKVPAELAAAKEWLRRSAAFYAGLEAREYAYFKTWKRADLAGEIEGVSPGGDCERLRTGLDAAPSNAKRYELVHVAWSNCMNQRKSEVLGDYPSAPWDAYVKKYRLVVKYRWEEP